MVSKQVGTSASQAGGKKRTLSLMNHEEVDLSTPIALATPQLFEAMRQRIIELEDQLEQYQRPTAKRAKTTATATPSTSANIQTTLVSGPTAASVKADEKKRKVLLKKIFDRLKKECKSDDVKFQGIPKTIKFDEVMEESEFEAIFGGKGVLIQPTPQNKPKSTVTIIQFNGQDHIAALFGEELKALKGNRWSRGGIHFGKSIKQGAVDVEITSIDVNYSKNGMKCSVKFEVDEVGGYGGHGGYGAGYMWKM